MTSVLNQYTLHPKTDSFTSTNIFVDTNLLVATKFLVDIYFALGTFLKCLSVSNDPQSSQNVDLFSVMLLTV